MLQEVAMPLFLSVAAGGATMIGALMAVMTRCPKPKEIAFAIGFSGGVMLAVSLMDLFPHALSVLLFELPAFAATAMAVFACAAGMLCAHLLDVLVPENERGSIRAEQRLMRLGLFSMLALMLHNLPEGMAVFLSASQSPKLGIQLCAAISLHNIPEGISVAMPVYAATRRRGIALLLAGISGAAEPMGALLAWRFLLPVLTERGLALIFCGIAGLMSAIVVSELLPAAYDSGEKGSGVLGALLGILLMLFNSGLF